jgi:hypothetical protein
VIQAERIVRKLPAVFAVIALVDVAKYLAIFWSIRTQLTFGVDRGIPIHFSALPEQDTRQTLSRDLVSSLFDAVIYPAGWMACAALLAILLGIYDRLQVRNA